MDMQERIVKGKSECLENMELEKRIRWVGILFYFLQERKKRGRGEWGEGGWHLATHKSGTTISQIDLVLLRKHDQLACQDCKVIPRESLTSRNKITTLDVCIRSKNRGKAN